VPPARPGPINSWRAVPGQGFGPTCQPGPARDTGVPCLSTPKSCRVQPCPCRAGPARPFGHIYRHPSFVTPTASLSVELVVTDSWCLRPLVASGIPRLHRHPVSTLPKLAPPSPPPCVVAQVPFSPTAARRCLPADLLALGATTACSVSSSVLASLLLQLVNRRSLPPCSVSLSDRYRSCFQSYRFSDKNYENGNGFSVCQSFPTFSSVIEI
jgi:hypothetical protein